MEIVEPPPGEEFDRVLMFSWQVFEIDTGDRYLIGIRFPENVICISAVVTGFELKTGVVEAKDGFSYVLYGPAEAASAVLNVWEQWCEQFEAKYSLNVSDEYDWALLEDDEG